MNPVTFLTRPVVTALSAICAGLSILTATMIPAAWPTSGTNAYGFVHSSGSWPDAIRLVVTALVLAVAAVALWMLRPEDDDQPPRPTYRRGPSLRERLAALTQPAPLPHRPASRYPGHGAPPAPAPSPTPEPTSYPEPPTPEPAPPAAPTFRADGEFSHLDSVFGHDKDGGQ